MILGFAHVAYSSADPEAAISLFNRDIDRRYEGVASHPAKGILLANAAKTHDLILLKGQPTIEVVSHDTGTIAGPETIGLDGSTIVLRVADPGRERAFLKAGFAAREEEDALLIPGVFPTWQATLKLHRSAQSPAGSPLDIDGFSCVAFYSSDLEQDRKRLLELGGHHQTEIFDVTLNGRRLDILMLRSPNGIIIELVKVARR